MLRFILIVKCLLFLSCDGSKSSFNQVNDCVGDSIPIDCSDTTIPGCAYINNCGICVGGNSNNDNGSCCPSGFSESLQQTVGDIECLPSDFLFYISTVQAGYLFNSVEIDGGMLETSNCNNPNDCDWVGAFNGDICVGAVQWNTDDCNNGICSINVMGYASELTSGYMQSGEYPTFKIYDVSESAYFNAIPSIQYPWISQEIYILDNLLGQP